jgi:phosphoenolpyruvate---glycerone phosphotransferase subunit DhaK
MSANIAMKMAEKEGLKIQKILTHEDIAPGANAPAEDRRGLVGCLPLIKIAGAAAEAGKTLREVYEIAERFNGNMATLAVAVKAATHPSTGESIFEMADDEMEIGMGQHGEGGTGRSKMMNANDTAVVMLNRLLDAIGAKKGDRLLMLLNGAGATTLMELFIVFRHCHKLLTDKGIAVVARVNEFLTVQEMAGFQMFAARLDDELLSLWNAPCDTPYLTVR